MAGQAEYLQFPIRGDKIGMRVHVREHVYHGTTPFQIIDVHDTSALGRVLLLDGHVQFAELDEHAYHEALVQIPLLSLPSPRRILVIGGGDGGVLREAAKHAGVERIDLVEIDREVIEVSKGFFPAVSGGAFGDPRVSVFVQDAFPFVRNTKTPYDLIVLDATDVYVEDDAALSEQLFSRDFYVDCLNALSPEGLFVTQADNHVFCPYSLRSILATLSSVFPRTGCYQAAVPSFGGFSAFAWASKGAELRKSMPSTNISLRYLNDATYRFALNMLEFGDFSSTLQA